MAVNNGFRLFIWHVSPWILIYTIKDRHGSDVSKIGSSKYSNSSVFLTNGCQELDGNADALRKRNTFHSRISKLSTEASKVTLCIKRALEQ